MGGGLGGGKGGGARGRTETMRREDQGTRWPRNLGGWVAATRGAWLLHTSGRVGHTNTNTVPPFSVLDCWDGSRHDLRRSHAIPPVFHTRGRLN